MPLIRLDQRLMVDLELNGETSFTWKKCAVAPDISGPGRCSYAYSSKQTLPAGTQNEK